MKTKNENVAHKIQIYRDHEIDTGHRVLNHEGKCKNLHGHRFKFGIFLNKPEDGLDHIGRVLDFGVIKEIWGGWLDENWDHGMLLWDQDPLTPWFKSELISCNVAGKFPSPLYGQKFYGLPFNPTAENLASYLLNKSRELLKPTGIEVAKIRCWETPKSYADAE